MNETVAKTEIVIEGMDCASCAAGIERTLRRLGLADASVNFATQSAYVTPNQSFPATSVVDEINKLGYSARVKGINDSPQLNEARESARHTALLYKAAIAVLLTVPLLFHMVASWHLLHNGWFQLLLATPVVAIGIQHFGRSAIASLRAGLPNMDVLIMVGVGAAYIYSLSGLLLGLGADYQFFETAATITSLVLVGNVLERHSVRKAASAIEDLSRAQVTSAKKLVTTNGVEAIVEIRGDQVAIGDRLRVNSGDKIPADGEIESGELLVDESIITGESLPLPRAQGAKVIGGSAVHSGSAVVKALQVGELSVLGGIVKLVREAQGDKPSIQRIGDIVSAYFTPIAILIAITTFLSWFFLFDLPFRDALLRSVAVLVIACPCAMGLATPTAVMVGIGRAARHGILIRGGSALETLAKASTVIFDKTGTLTSGNFKIGELTVAGIDRTKAISLIIGLENQSSHPIARSLVAELSGQAPPFPFIKVEERKGFGMVGHSISGALYSLGTSASLEPNSTEPRDGRLVLAMNGKAVAHLQIGDSLKTGAKEAVARLQELGLTTVLLSGDHHEKCSAVAKELGISQVYSEQSPQQKLDIVETLQQKNITIFVGDGINDAPALAKAGIGVAMGDGTHLAVQSSDIVLLHGSLGRLVEAVALARATLLTIKQNLFWAFSYNIIAIPVAALGFLNPMIAAFAMGFSDVMTIGNSLRLRKKQL